MVNRITTMPQPALQCNSLPIPKESLEFSQMSAYVGGVGENAFLSYAVGYTTGAVGAALALTVSPVAGGAVIIAGGVYGIATAIDPTINDKVAETAASLADSAGDLVSEWWNSGSNTNLSFGNGYY